MRLTVHPVQRVPSTLVLLEIGSELSQMKRTGSYIRLCWVWQWPLNYSTETRSVAESPALLMQTHCRLLHGHKRIYLCRGVSQLILLFTWEWNRLNSKVVSLRFVGLLYLVCTCTYGRLHCSIVNTSVHSFAVGKGWLNYGVNDTDMFLYQDRYLSSWGMMCRAKWHLAITVSKISVQYRLMKISNIVSWRLGWRIK